MPGRCNTAAAATGNASALPPGAVPDSTGSGRKRGRNGPGLQPVERNPSAIECLSMPGSGADPAQIGRGLPASEAGRRVCSRAYGVCPGAYRQQKSSTYRALGVCSGACTRPSQPRRRQAPQVPVRARQSAYARTRKPAASGVTKPLPKEVGMTLCAALRFRLTCRSRNGLEPSRRLSEPAGRAAREKARAVRFVQARPATEDCCLIPSRSRLRRCSPACPGGYLHRQPRLAGHDRTGSIKQRKHRTISYRQLAQRSDCSSKKPACTRRSASRCRPRTK